MYGCYPHFPSFIIICEKKKTVSIGEWDSNPRPLGGGFIILVQWPPMPLFLDIGSLSITFKHRILGYQVQWSSGQNFIVKRKSRIALCHIWINIKMHVYTCYICDGVVFFGIEEMTDGV